MGTISAEQTIVEPVVSVRTESNARDVAMKHQDGLYDGLHMAPFEQRENNLEPTIRDLTSVGLKESGLESLYRAFSERRDDRGRHSCGLRHGQIRQPERLIHRQWGRGGFLSEVRCMGPSLFYPQMTHLRIESQLLDAGVV